MWKIDKHPVFVRKPGVFQEIRVGATLAVALNICVPVGDRKGRPYANSVIPSERM